MSTSKENAFIGIYKISLKNMPSYDMFNYMLRIDVGIHNFQRPQLVKGFSNPWPEIGDSWEKMEKYYWK
ncbi:MAG: hypothetical protein GY797_30980 [Deltaproteobacteria bacterium]|nr:hypothetical protein [Deltaproteobacteria bacterium]